MTTALVDAKVPFRIGRRDTMLELLARALARLGVHKGDCVVTLLDTCTDVFICWFAINKLGAIWVPINTAYRGDFLRHQVADTEARIVICDGHWQGQSPPHSYGRRRGLASRYFTQRRFAACCP